MKIPTALVLALPVVALPAALARPSLEPPAVPTSVDVNHSTCGFSVPILGGLSQVTGKFASFTVDLDFDPEDPARSRVSAVIDASSVDTGIDDRDRHLEAPDFFDVANHPEIQFHSKDVIANGAERLAVVGDLTVRGKTKEVLLDVEMHRSAEEEPDVVGFTATTTFDRTDFDVSYQHRDIPDFIGADVTVTIHTYARLRR